MYEGGVCHTAKAFGRAMKPSSVIQRQQAHLVKYGADHAGEQCRTWRVAVRVACEDGSTLTEVRKSGIELPLDLNRRSAV